MTEQVFMTTIKVMGEKIQMLEWENGNLRTRLEEAQAAAESLKITVYRMSGGDEAKGAIDK